MTANRIHAVTPMTIPTTVPAREVPLEDVCGATPATVHRLIIEVIYDTVHTPITENVT